MNVHSPPRRVYPTFPRDGAWVRLRARFFHRILDRIDAGIAAGALEATLPDGSFRILGDRKEGPVARVDLVKWRALVRLVRSGSVGWYEAWEAGEWASPDPVPLFELFMQNRVPLGGLARSFGLSRLGNRLMHWLRRNTPSGAARNIEAHYDLGNDFYAAWLDGTMSYSSGLFAEPIGHGEAFQDAQRRKCEAVLGRLQVPSSAEILEIGSGWGYLSRFIALAGHNIVGITLSPAQKAWAERAAIGLSNPPRYALQDYRDVKGQYDGIVSVEMVEAVGRAYWPAYLDTIARCLKPGARAAIQYISIADEIFETYADNVDFIQRYVFPGGMLLSQSRFRALAGERGLAWKDQHDFGMHYAETLKRWRERFDAAVDEGRLPGGFDAQFVRLWRYYLQYCEGGFRGGGIDVSQVTLVKR